MDQNKNDPSSQQLQSLNRSSPTNPQHSTSQQNDNQLPQHHHQPSQNQQTQSSQSSQLNQSTQQLQQANPNFDSNVISERVKNLATQIYQELKRIISRCNYDEDILSGLMPLIVRVLESLDLALIDNQQLQVELELCKDDNEQLVVMFEKEKAAKRISDKKLIESEFAYEEERQQYQQKIESLDGTVKMMELKAKNASDQATRLEEKENERKKEYQKLHDRYTELLKSHCDVVERVRHLVGNQDIATLSSINVPQQMVASSASSDINYTDLQQPINQSSHKLRQLRSDEHIDHDNNHRNLNKSSREALRSWNAETELTIEDASLVVIEDVLGTGGHSKPHHTQHASQSGDASSQNESDRLNPSELDSGEHEKESENDSIAYTSMEKEFRKLIQDNKDLLNTKNALNVVKDDLIAEVDRLTNEVSMYEQAVEQLNSTKEQMKQKVSILDAELRKTKDELEKAKQKIRENNEEGVPYAQRKRFGRAEMAKVLMERNEYKEKFMELQDAIKYTELVRANKSESEKRSGLWKFFSNLFGAPQPLAIGPGSGTLSRSSSTLVSYHTGTDHHQGSMAGGVLVGGSGGPIASGSGGLADLSFMSGAGGAVGPSGASSTGSFRSVNQRLTSNADMIVLMDSDLNMDRSRSSGSLGVVGLGPSRDGTSRFMANEQQGYIHAYGWSLPMASFRNMTLTGANLLASTDNDNESSTSTLIRSLPGSAATGNDNRRGSSGGTLRIPIPQYCRPLTGDSSGMKIWCATVIDLSGGDNLDPQQQQKLTDSEAADTSIVSTVSAQSQEATTTLGGEQSSESLVNISNTNESLISGPSTPSKDSSALNELKQEVDQALKQQQLQDRSSLTGGPISSTPHQSKRASAGRRSIESARLTPNKSTTRRSPVDQELSSFVWICSTQHSRSKITVIDINNKPNEMLDSFFVPTFLYCIQSVPGCKMFDLPGLVSADSFVVDNEEDTDKDKENQEHNQAAKKEKSPLMNLIEELIATQKRNFYQLVRVNEEEASRALQDRIEAKCNLMMRQNSSQSQHQNQSNMQTSFTQQSGSEEVLERSLEDEINFSQRQLEQQQRDSLNKTTASTSSSNTTTINNQSTSSNLDYEDPVISRVLDNNVSDGIARLEKLNDFVAHTQAEHSTNSSTVDNTNKHNTNYNESRNTTTTDGPSRMSERRSSGPHHHPISTHLPTVWMGGKDSILYVHSAIGQWGDLVDCVKLPDSILQIFHYRGRVFVALADGLLCVFFRDIKTKHWDLRNYLRIDINLLAEISAELSSDYTNFNDNVTQHTQTSSPNVTPKKQQQSSDEPSGPVSLSDQLRDATERQQHEEAIQRRTNTKPKVAGIRCIELANNNLWIGYRNRVLIIDPISLKLKHSLSIVPQLDNQVRQLVSMKDGVFCCLRSDLMLRLYSSLKPYQHIQNIDIEPVVTRLLSPRTFVISHITSMKVADNMVWIGIAHGIIITIPCSLETLVSETVEPTKSPPILESDDNQPESLIEGTSGYLNSIMSIAKSIPKCDIANAQISFHGHKDAVKFFIHTHRLMLSGGQGYLDFRLDMDDQSKSINDKSHLILWQMPNTN